MGTLRPVFDSMAVLLVVLPFSDISGSVCVFVSASTIAFIIQPLALVDITISVIENTLTTGMVKLPIAIVFCTVRPLHAACAVP